jgi:hypothetical protein
VNSSVLPFGNSILDITIIAEVKENHYLPWLLQLLNFVASYNHGHL